MENKELKKLRELKRLIQEKKQEQNQEVVKTSANLTGVHDLSTASDVPRLSRSPFVRLHQLQKKKERLFKKQDRLLRKLTQVAKQLPSVERDLERLYKKSRPSNGSEVTKESGKKVSY